MFFAAFIATLSRFKRLAIFKFARAKNGAFKLKKMRFEFRLAFAFKPTLKFTLRSIVVRKRETFKRQI